MIPILFPESETIYTTNGIGRLSDVISCKVTEERNGQYELTMKYPVTGSHFDDISIRKIIVVKPAAGSTLQAFRIYQISKPRNGRVEIDAQHISYDLSKNVSMPFSVNASASACSQTLAALKTNAVENCPFTFQTDVTTVSGYNQLTPASIRQRLGGIEGSVLDQFGGEFEWDNWTVKLWKNRGSNRGVTLRYGKNITDITQEENIADTIVGVVPFWINLEGTERVVLPEKVIYSQYADRYSQKLIAPLDLSGDYQDKPTEETIRNAARAYINKAGIGIPKISIDVSFVALWQTEEYKDIAPLQQVKLCDTVSIDFEPLGITGVSSKVVQTVYDVLAERYEKISLGSIRSNLATTITDQTTGITETVAKQFTQVGNEINNATAWLTSSNGYVIAVKNNDGSWKELIFADHNDPTQWHNLLRINENGIGFSSDGGSTYKQGWTLDGRILIGGSNATSLTVYKQVGGVDTVLFEVTPNYIVWNAPNSSMDSTGKITAQNATIQGTLTTGIEALSSAYIKIDEDGIHSISQVTSQELGTITCGNWIKLICGGSIELIGGNDTNDNIRLAVDAIWLTCNKLYIGDSSTSYSGRQGLSRTITFEDGDGLTREFEFCNGILVSFR